MDHLKNNDLNHIYKKKTGVSIMNVIACVAVLDPSTSRRNIQNKFPGQVNCTRFIVLGHSYKECIYEREKMMFTLFEQ